METPLISIVIPIFNVEEYIVECLDSVAAQTYNSAIECLLIDDCGTDRSIELVKDWIIKYTGPIKFDLIHHKKNLGLSAARNTGIEAAKGNYIFFLDSDDILKKNCIGNFILYTQNYGQADVVICGIELIGGKESDLPRVKEALPQLLQGEEIIRTFCRFDWFVLAQSKFYSRFFLRDHNILFMEGIIHEDNLWSFDVASNASSLGIIKSADYLYRIREGSIMTSTKMAKRLNSMLIIIEEIQHRIEQNKSNKVDKNKYMLQLLYSSLGAARKDLPNSEYKNFYKRLRSKIKWGLFSTFVTFGFSPKLVVRDAHFSFPVNFGFIFYNFVQSIK